MTRRILAVLALVIALLPAAPALAAGSVAGPAPGLSAVNPGRLGYFTLAAPPDAGRTIEVEVSNLTNSTQTYRVYPVGATTSPATGVSYDVRSTPALGVGSWLAPAQQLVTLRAHQVAAVPFVVRVPEAVLPGDHVGGIAAENVLQPTPSVISGSHGSRAALVETTRVVIAVVVRTPGPAVVAMQLGRPKLGVQDGVRQYLLFPMRDTGGLLFQPRLVAAVAPCGSSAPVLEINRQLDTFVPRTAIQYAYYPATNLASGCYHARAQVYQGSRLLSAVAGAFRVSSAQASVHPATAPPAPAGARASGPGNALELVFGGLVAILLIVILVLLFMLARRRRDERPPAPTVSLPVPAPRPAEPAAPPARRTAPAGPRGVRVSGVTERRAPRAQKASPRTAVARSASKASAPKARGKADPVRSANAGKSPERGKSPARSAKG